MSYGSRLALSACTTQQEQIERRRAECEVFRYMSVTIDFAYCVERRHDEYEWKRRRTKRELDEWQRENKEQKSE